MASKEGSYSNGDVASVILTSFKTTRTDTVNWYINNNIEEAERDTDEVVR